MYQDVDLIMTVQMTRPVSVVSAIILAQLPDFLVALMPNVEFQNIVQYVCVQMDSRENLLSSANHMNAFVMKTASPTSIVEKTRLAGTHVLKLEFVELTHSAVFSIDVHSVLVLLDFLATQKLNAKLVSLQSYSLTFKFNLIS